ncbi:hypothetical protein [Serratia marcescens]|uniref:hypothetical protein n=1 Tax=Serratia marcescens TaxID=615 RepID=UPI00313D0D39
MNQKADLDEALKGIMLCTSLFSNLAMLDVGLDIRIVVRCDWGKRNIAIISGSGSGSDTIWHIHESILRLRLPTFQSRFLNKFTLVGFWHYVTTKSVWHMVELLKKRYELGFYALYKQ